MAERNDTLIPGLPNEIAIFCMARVPRTNHRHMSGVCQSWRKLLRGRDFWEVRRRLSLIEEWLYLWTELGNTWRSFDPALKKWLKLPAMPHDNRIAGHSAFASMDGKLFVIGGNLSSFYNTDKSYIPCRTVSYFDVRSYCWKKAADLNVARAKCMVGVIDNQLYVFGGYIEGFKKTTITAEAYDPITNTWRFISNMKRPTAMCDCVTTGGKCYAINFKQQVKKGVVYDAETDKWEDMAKGLYRGWESKTTVLNGKFYTVGQEYVAGNLEDEYEPRRNQLLQVYDPRKAVWEIIDASWHWSALMLVMGFTAGVELVSFGGELCIICVEDFSLGGENVDTMICMAILNVEDSTENHTCSVSLREDFDIEAPNEGLHIARGIKRCQVVAL